MKIFEKKSSVKIEEEDLKDAKLSSMDFTDSFIKKRAFVGVLGARLAMKLLFSQKIEANNIYSLYTIHNVLEELDIADIYFQGIKIDVRVVFNDGEIFIPKSHFEYNLQPDVYFVMQLKKDLSSAEFLGFVESSDIDKTKENKEFYFHSCDKLQKPEDLKDFLDTFIVENNHEVPEENVVQSEKLFLYLVDKGISKKDKAFLLKQLANSISLREKLVEFENFEIISYAAAKSTDLIQDEFMGVVGAQNAVEEGALSELEKADEMAEALGRELPSQKGKVGFDNLLAEAGENVILDGPQFESLEDEDNRSDDSKSDGLGTLAAGMAIGGTIAAAGALSASAAGAQGELISGAADVVSSGIDAASDLINTGLSNGFSDIGVNDFSTDGGFDDLAELAEGFSSDSQIENSVANAPIEELSEIGGVESLPQIEDIAPLENLDSIAQDLPIADETTAEIINDSVLPELDMVQDAVLDELPALEPIGDLEPLEQDLSVTDVAPDEIITNSLSPELDMVSDETLNDLPELESLDELAPLEEALPADNQISDVDTPNEELYQNNEAAELYESSEENQNLNEYSNEVENEEESQDADEDLGEVVNLEDFDFDMFNDEEESTTEEDNQNSDLDTLSLDDMLQEDEAQGQELGRPIEDNEISDAVYQSEQPDEQFNDIASQIDDLLNDEDDTEGLSEDELIERALASGFDDDLNEMYSAEKAPDQNGDKDLLQALFQKEQVNGQGRGSIDKNRKMIVAASIASVIFVSLVVGGVAIHNKNSSANMQNSVNTTQMSADAQNQPMSPQDNQNSQDNLLLTDNSNNQGLNQAPPQQQMDQSLQQIGGPQEIPADNKQNQQAVQNRDMNKAVSDAFLSEPVNATISKVAWEVPEELAYNDSFRRYLQMAGKNLKLNLQNDLLLATEMAYSNKVVADLQLNRNGSVQAANVTVSSGSKQIDKIVLQSVKETLQYLKMPSGEINTNSIVITLIINF